MVISGVVEHWPAYQKWDMPYLSEKLGDSIVTVDVTPNGFGDAVLLTEEVCDLLHVILHYRSCSSVACLLACSWPPRAPHIFKNPGPSANSTTVFKRSILRLDRHWQGDEVFVKPEERRMPFSAFVAELLEPQAARTGTAVAAKTAHDTAASTGTPCAVAASTVNSTSSADAGAGVQYLSHQNDSLRHEFGAIACDVPPVRSS